MSKTVKTTRVWNGLMVDQYTNTETGVIEIKSGEFLGIHGDLLATGDAKGNWTINDKEGFRRRYNNRQTYMGKKKLTKKEFEQEFNKDGKKKFNNDRAAVLNKSSNYDNKKDAKAKQEAFADNGIPGVKDPKTGKKNNSKGKAAEDPDNNENDPNTKEEGKEKSTKVEEVLKDLKQFEEVEVKFTQDHLRYPLDRLPDLGYDFVEFKAHHYAAGLLTDPTGFKRLGGELETITLPIIPNIEETHSTNWQEDKMNPIQEKAGGIAAATLMTVKEGKSFAEIMSTAGQATGEAIQSLVGDPDMGDAIVGHFSGQAVGANVLGRMTGAVLNPNLELLFNGPTLRQFSFNFKMRPRFAKEAEEIKKIIRAFKRNMNVQRTPSYNFLLTPNIFTIKYFSNDGEPHPYLYNMKPCALTSFKVGYTPDNSYMTYKDNDSMTGYDISLSFNEIAPIYADDQNTATGTGF